MNLVQPWSPVCKLSNAGRKLFMKSNRIGMLALLAVGGYWLYRNRSSVSQFLQDYGIKTPFDSTGKLAESIRAGVGKLKATKQDQLSA